MLRIIAVMVLLAGIITGLGFIYGDRIKKVLVDKLDRQLNTRISVNQVSFSVWKKFPLATVTFNDVVVPGAWSSSSPEDPDTLLQAESFYFSMNLLDIFDEHQTFTSVGCEKGTLRLRFNAKGDGNYNIFKTSSDTGEVSLKLNEILMERMVVDYAWPARHDTLLGWIEDIKAAGNLSDEIFSLFSSLDGSLHTLILSGINYPVYSKTCSVNGNMSVNTSNSSFGFDGLKLKLANMAMNMTGTVTSEKYTTCDLTMSGEGLRIEDVLTLLPEEYQQQVKQYSSEGDFNFAGSIKGQFTSTTVPVFAATFGITNGKINYREGKPLEKILLNGSFTNNGIPGGRSAVVKVDVFSAAMASSVFNGNFTLKNFQAPHLTLQTRSQIDLGELMLLIPADSLPQLTGKVQLEAEYSGYIRPDGNYTLEDFRRARTSGELTLDSVNIIPLTGNSFTALSGSFLFDNNDVIVNRLNGLIGKSDFQLKGFFRKIISYFFVDNSKLVVDAVFRSDSLDINDLISESDDEGSANFNFNFTDQAAFHLRAEVGHLVWSSFNASSVKGKVVFRDRKLVTEDLTLSAFGGNLHFSGMVDAADPGDILISCRLDGKEVDIRQLFEGCENFGQETMQASHLKGIATIGLYFKAATDSSLTLQQDEVYALADIVIKEGELIGFEPMKRLSRFIKVEELEHIRFGELSNQIEIRERKIIIPRMHIASSALDIDLSGWHSFDNEIDYRFKVMLGDILSGKARKSRKENEDYAVFEEDKGRRRMALFLAMTGTVDNPKFRYDRIGLGEKIKSDAVREKQEVKAILKEEFGVFSKDTTLHLDEETKPVNFEIEWEGQPEKSQTQSEPDPDRFRKKESKFRRWLNTLPGDSIE